MTLIDFQWRFATVFLDLIFLDVLVFMWIEVRGN